MTISNVGADELQNLARVGHLKREPPSPPEYNGLVASARKRLVDAANPSLAAESRFDLAYNAAHGFSLAALRRHGYRPVNRYVVFQALPHTLGMPPSVWRVLAKAHAERNLAEYEGMSEVDAQLLADLIDCTEQLQQAMDALGPLAND